MSNKNIGFIGAGYMGYGMAYNLIKNNYNISVFSHKNRIPIEKLLSQGAIECKNLQEIAKNNTIIMCVPNTNIAKDIINNIKDFLKPNTFIIDITTHNVSGPVEINNILKNINVRYVESPVMGGPTQSIEGVLGAIVGSSAKDFKYAKKILSNFCKNVIHFGDEIGIGAKTKLISNFLSLGTATFVIETLKVANHNQIDLSKLYDVAKLGSGSSVALERIAKKAIEGDYKGFIFSVNNTFKDFSYINEMMHDQPNAKKLSSVLKSIYGKEVKQGYGDLLISELINKK